METETKIEAKVEAKSPKKGNVVVILTSIGMVLFLVLSVWFYVEKEDEQDKRMTAEKKLEQTLVAKKVVEQNLKEATENNEKLTAEVQQFQTEVETLQAKVTEVTEEKDRLAQQAETTAAKLEEISGLLEAEKTEKQSLVSELESLKTEYETAQEKLTVLEDEKVKLEDQLKQAKAQQQPSGKEQSTVDLGKVTVGSTQISSPNLPGKMGRILVVNDEFNFVVVSFGKNDGLKGGEVLTVFREGQLVGTVQVEKLYDAISAATILDEKTGVYREGDSVRL